MLPQYMTKELYKKSSCRFNCSLESPAFPSSPCKITLIKSFCIQIFYYFYLLIQPLIKYLPGIIRLHSPYCSHLSFSDSTFHFLGRRYRVAIGWEWRTDTPTSPLTDHTWHIGRFPPPFFKQKNYIYKHFMIRLKLIQLQSMIDSEELRTDKWWIEVENCVLQVVFFLL